MTQALHNENRDGLLPLLNQEGDLEDGGKTIIRCSSCEKPLTEIWVIQPSTKIISEIYASCPYCEDCSFVYKFNGKFCIGHLKDTVVTETEEEYCDVDDDGVIRQKIKVIVVKEK